MRIDLLQQYKYFFAKIIRQRFVKSLVKIIFVGFLILTFTGCNTLKVQNIVGNNTNNQKLTEIEIQWNKPESFELIVPVAIVYGIPTGIPLERRERHLQQFGKLNKVLKKNVPMLLQEKMDQENVKVDTNATILLSLAPTSYSPYKKMKINTRLFNKSNKKVLWQSELIIPLMNEILIVNVAKDNSQITDSIVDLIMASLTDLKYIDDKSLKK